ncbi:NAD(P)/FAD-dependent oxidoreductase [Limibacillus halophilus]
MAKTVAVIGAGAIGVCTALSLRRDGHDVLLIDRQGPGEGASFGNGSVISEEAVVPIATPGIWTKVPKMLLDPLGPLALRWSYLPKLTPWLLRFLLASRTEKVEEITGHLAALMEGSLAAFDPLLEMAGEPDFIHKTGWACVYETDSGFADDEEYRQLQARHGVRYDVLGPEELRQLEPALAPHLKKGVFYPDVGFALNNFRLVQLFAEAFEKAGGKILREEVRDFEIGPEGPEAVLTDKGRHAFDAVVVAAGAWSRPLAERLGAPTLLDTERGYHMHYPEPGIAPRLPVYSTERAFVATPLEHGLRVAGTVELGGLQAPPNWERAKVLERNVSRIYPGLETEGGKPWMGFRPSMPDSLPVIGRSPRHPNAFLAFGHGHCGLMLSARTGALLADMVAGRGTPIDMTPYRPDRF